MSFEHKPRGGTGNDSTGEEASTPGKRALAAPTRARMESSYGVSFDGVGVHPDSPRTSGSTHAFTEGSDIHFAPGAYQPGTARGDWLIAHELAHVVQQRGGGPTGQAFDPTAPSLGHEAEADRAADAAVAGRKAEIRLSTRAGARQNYEAWEHRALGDAGGGDQRRIRVDCGIELTYGQVVALSGDFYRSPEALMRAPRGELEAILRTMEQERTQSGVTADNAFGTGRPTDAEAAQNNAEYELATTGPGSRAHHHDHAHENPLLDEDQHGGHDHDDHDHDDHDHDHGRVHEGEHVEDNGPDGGAPASATDAFLDLADNNASHFSPENIVLNWKPKHQHAIDLAKEAWRARNPTSTPAATGPATATPAPTTPAPATPAPTAPATPAPTTTPAPATTPAPGAGLPATTAPGTTSTTSAAPGDRQESMAYLMDGFGSHFLTDSFAAGHLVSGSVGRGIGERYFNSHRGTIMAALGACMVRDYPAACVTMPDGAMFVLNGIMALVQYKAGSLTLKLVHDHFNRSGIEVKNKKGTQWRTVGDSRLNSSPETMRQASLATTASRAGVDVALRDGDISDEQRDEPIEYIPDQAQFAGGGWQPISTFCRDETIFDAVLSATMLSPDPAVNELWKLVKSNVGPMIALKLRQAGRWVGDLATGAYEAVETRARAVGRAALRGARTLRDGAVEVGERVADRAREGARTVRDGAVRVGETIADGARTARDNVVDGARTVRDGVVDGARTARDGVVSGARTARGGRSTGRTPSAAPRGAARTGWRRGSIEPAQVTSAIVATSAAIVGSARSSRVSARRARSRSAARSSACGARDACWGGRMHSAECIVRPTIQRTWRDHGPAAPAMTHTAPHSHASRRTDGHAGSA